MNGPHQPYYLSVRHANSALAGRTVQSNGSDKRARVLCVSIDANGSPDEYQVQAEGQTPEWVEASKWTVVN